MGIPQDVGKGLDLFRTLIFDSAVDAELAALGVTEIPLLGGIISSLIKKFADSLYERLAGAVVFGTILFVDLQHRKIFDDASLTLKKVAIEKGINSPEFKDAHEKEKAALKKFIQFGAAN